MADGKVPRHIRKPEHAKDAWFYVSKAMLDVVVEPENGQAIMVHIPLREILARIPKGNPNA